MIKEIPDELVDGVLKCRTTLEIYCPHCGRDVDEAAEDGTVFINVFAEGKY